MQFKVEQLSDAVFACVGQSGHANSGFVVGDHSIAVIDTQSNPSDGLAMRQIIASISDLPVTHVLITHHHGDHLFGIGAWPDAEWLSHPNCTDRVLEIAKEGMLQPNEEMDASTILRLFVGRNAANAILQMSEHPIVERLKEPEFNRIPLHVPMPLDRGWVSGIDLGGVVVEPRYLGRGHGDDDITVWVNGDEIAFLGDQAFFGRIPTVASPYVGEWANLSNDLLGISADTVIVPGHGSIGTSHDIALQASYLHGLCEMVSGARTEKSVEREFHTVDRFKFGHQLNLLVMSEVDADMLASQRRHCDRSSGGA